MTESDAITARQSHGRRASGGLPRAPGPSPGSQTQVQACITLECISMNNDPFATRIPYAYPASHKGYSAYSRETYTGDELDYRGKPAPTPQEPEPCEQPS